MKIKIMSAFAGGILFLIPLIVAGAIISNPLGFLGEIIFGYGDTSSINEDVNELYIEFLKSDIGIEVVEYIVVLEKEHNVFVEQSEIIIPLLLSIDDSELDTTHEITIDDLSIKEKVKDLYNARIENEDIHIYLQTIKAKDNFKEIANLSDTTLINYFDELSSLISSSGNSSDIDVDKPIYQNENNPFLPTYRGQCTWFAWSRTKELTGKNMPTGNARDWFELTNLSKGNEPRSNSVAVFKGTKDYPENQHVIYIEDFENGMITFSEGNYNNPCVYGTCDMVEYARENYKELINVETMPYSIFLIQRQFDLELVGYIYTN